MNYNFTETQKNKITERWGQNFYLKILRYIEIYTEKWILFDFEFVEYYSFNAIFLCKSELYGGCVLKIGNIEYDDFVAEYSTLCEYNNSGKFCRVFECDLENTVMLIERIIPGQILRDEPFLEKRLAVFSDLFDRLHIEPGNPELYPPYANWVIDTADYIINKQEDYNELYVHAVKAKNIYLEIASAYNKKLLIHGDLHFENIISCGNGKYKIIDPFGWVGDSVSDVGRYISQEYWKADSKNQLDIVNKIIDYFEKSLTIPKTILKQCFYIDITICNCWISKDGFAANLNEVKFAETVLNNI